jgi:hypothetical protein
MAMMGKAVERDSGLMVLPGREHAQQCDLIIALAARHYLPDGIFYWFQEHPCGFRDFSLQGWGKHGECPMLNQERFHSDRLDSVRQHVIPADARDGSLNELQAAIGRWLSAEYDLEQSIPQRLVDLLRQLEQLEPTQ